MVRLVKSAVFANLFFCSLGVFILFFYTAVRPIDNSLLDLFMWGLSQFLIIVGGVAYPVRFILSQQHECSTEYETIEIIIERNDNYNQSF